MKCEYNENNHILVLHTLNCVVAISVKFFCFTRPFVPNLEAKSVVPELTTRDSDHWWWSLLATTFTPNLSTWRPEQNGSWLPDYIYTKSKDITAWAKWMTISRLHLHQSLAQVGLSKMADNWQAAFTPDHKICWLSTRRVVCVIYTSLHENTILHHVVTAI